MKNASTFIRIFLVCIAFLQCEFIAGFPNGAPIAACTNGGRPTHPGNPQAQTGHAEYIVTHNMCRGHSPYITYKVVLSGPRPFKGFFCRVLHATTGKPVGTFQSSFLPAGTRHSSCSISARAVTQINRLSGVRQLTFKWTAPRRNEASSIIIKCTVVESKSIFWMIQSGASNELPRGTVRPTCPEPRVAAASNPRSCGACPAGVQGQKGFKGDIGEPSSLMGNQGAQGPDGPKGMRGEPGPDPISVVQNNQPARKGHRGDKGHPGPLGEVGWQGSPGPGGIRGPKGGQGPRGDDSVVDSLLKGSRGEKGGRSVTPGRKGEKGEVGATGIQGPKGNPAGPSFYQMTSAVQDQMDKAMDTLLLINKSLDAASAIPTNFIDSLEGQAALLERKNAFLVGQASELKKVVDKFVEEETYPTVRPNRQKPSTAATACDTCVSPLGMQRGLRRFIEDDHLSGSDSFLSYEVHQARPFGQLAWVPQSKNRPFIQVDLRRKSTITRIVTQGLSETHNFVSQYQVYYSQATSPSDSVISEDWKTLGHVCKGNSNTDDLAFCQMPCPNGITARHVRIEVLRYNRWPSLRFELLGC